MPDWTAITGIVVAGVLGPGFGAWWANERQKRALWHQRAMSDRAELRHVLDEGAEVLRRGLWAVERIAAEAATIRRFDSRSVREHREVKIEAIAEEGRASVEASALASGRIALRLGREAPVYARFEEAVDILAALGQQLAEVPDRLRGLRKLVVAGDFAGQFEVLIGPSRDEFLDARARYIDEAHRVVKAQLES